MDNQNGRMPDGRLECLEMRILQLLGQSRDYYYTEYLQKMLVKVRSQKMQADLLQNELDRSYQMYLQRNPFVANQAVEPTVKQTSSYQTYVPTVDEMRRDAPRQAPVRKQNTEFTVGVAVFSVIGVVFILAAFVMLGMNFMNGFVKGMSLYAIALVLLLVSELLLYKKNPKIGRAVTAIGIGGLFLSTVINYLQLHNFNGIAAMTVTAVITAGTLLLSHKRESGLLRVIGITACYLCFLPIGKSITGVQFIVMTAMLFLMNLMCALLPAKRSGVTLGIVHMISNTLFSQVFLWRAAWCGVTPGYQEGFLLSSFVIFNFIFLLLLRLETREKETGRHADRTGILTAYCISAVLFVEMFGFIVFSQGNISVWVRHSSMALAAVICAVFFFLERKQKEKWVLYYFVQVMAFVFYGFSLNDPEPVACILALLLAAKLLTGIKELAVSEALVTAAACLGVLAYSDTQYVYILGAGVALSVLFIHRWRTFYEILLTLTCAALALITLPNLIRLPAAAGIWFVGILIFHNVKRWKGRHIRVFNYVALSGMAICFLILSQRIYSRAYLTYLMMLVFGLATVVLTFQEKYEMDFKYKYVFLSIFLTYMAFISRTGIPVFTSIVLMVIALISVGVGFALREKSVRIYGLVLSLFVCAKVTLYDFVGAAEVQRMILFFAVGAIALVISGIYIVLEKKYREPKCAHIKNN